MTGLILVFFIYKEEFNFSWGMTGSSVENRALLLRHVSHFSQNAELHWISFVMGLIVFLGLNCVLTPRNGVLGLYLFSALWRRLIFITIYLLRWILGWSLFWAIRWNSNGGYLCQIYEWDLYVGIFRVVWLVHRFCHVTGITGSSPLTSLIQYCEISPIKRYVFFPSTPSSPNRNFVLSIMANSFTILADLKSGHCSSTASVGIHGVK